jgi:hypothetical protein
MGVNVAAYYFSVPEFQDRYVNNACTGCLRNEKTFVIIMDE